MSDTPRTDKETGKSIGSDSIVYASFARQLERELTEAREQRDGLAKELDALKQSMLDLSHPNMKLLLEERNEAREQIVANHKATLVIERMFYEVKEQRDRLAEAARTLPDYDAGLLNDFGGGDAEWWQDYIRAEIGRANEYWREALAAVKSQPTKS